MTTKLMYRDMKVLVADALAEAERKKGKVPETVLKKSVDDFLSKKDVMTTITVKAVELFNGEAVKKLSAAAKVRNWLRSKTSLWFSCM